MYTCAKAVCCISGMEAHTAKHGPMQSRQTGMGIDVVPSLAKLTSFTSPLPAVHSHPRLDYGEPHFPVRGSYSQNETSESERPRP